jgi:hypothetical protein
MRTMDNSSNYEYLESFVKVAAGIGETHLQSVEMRLLCKLAEIHMEIWDLEDLARSNVAETEVIVKTKKRIDILNARRHEFIDSIDMQVVRHCSLPTVSYSETPGEILDRLMIISLKIRANLAISINPLLPDLIRQSGCERKLRLSAWRVHLQSCLFSLLNDINLGRASVPPRSEFKLYNDQNLNPILRAEMQNPNRDSEKL